MKEKTHRPGEPDPHRTGWLPLIVFVLLCFLSFFIWRNLKDHEAGDLDTEVALTSATLVARIDADLDSRLKSLRRMADRWTIRGGTPQREFLFDASAYFADQPGYQALGWVDADFLVRWIVPLEGNERTYGLDMGSEARRRAALEEAKALRSPIATAPVDLVQGRKEILVCLPLYAGDTFEGFILAAFRLHEWLDYVLTSGGRLSIDDFDISVSFDGIPVYDTGCGETDASGSKYFFATSETVLLGHRIEVGVRPTPAYIASAHTSLPLITTLTGLIIPFLVAYVVYLLRVTRAEASIIEQALKKLESEALARGKIEEAVRIREQRVCLLLDSTAEAIFGIDLHGACAFANRACLLMLGYADVKAIIGRNMHSLMHHTWPDGSPMEEGSCGMSRALRDGVEIHRDDEVLWRADGTSFPAEYWSYPEIRDGVIMGAVITFLDISARIETETALVAASRDLETQVEKRTRALSEAHHRIMEQQLLEQDLRMAGQIQSDLLPESFPVMEGFEFASRAQPSRYLNGDFYDYDKHGTTYFSMMLADISGKGLSAALLAASARSLYRRTLIAGGANGVPGSPSAILEELGGDMFPDLARTERFITIVAARLDLVTGAFEVANAGGCEVILFDASDGGCRTLQKGNLPIGIFAGSTVTSETVGLRPGTGVILYSDGITEATNPAGELFGLPRLLDQVMKSGRSSAEEQLGGILAAVEAFQQGQPQSDDMTLIALRAKPRRMSLSFVSSLDSLNEIPMRVASYCYSYGEDAARDLELAISEILANIREHGYASREGPVELELRLETRGIELLIRERGTPFDIYTVAPPRLGRPADSGFGLHLIREVTDHFSYEPGGKDGNLWILFRSIEHGRNPA